jgi:cytidine deaminase
LAQILMGAKMAGLDELFERARAARARSYAPYSRFPVGAALRGASGAVFSGCNVENAAYPLGVCAETSAISAMVAAGETRIAEILILGPGPGRIAPCGACRQRIAEFAPGEALIHLADDKGVVETVSVADLLPMAFGPASLARG